jgi:hypothetical protein
MKAVEHGSIEQLSKTYGLDLGVLRFLQRGEIRGVCEHVARVLSFVASFVAFLWLCISPVHSHIFYAARGPAGRNFLSIFPDCGKFGKP